MDENTFFAPHKNIPIPDNLAQQKLLAQEIAELLCKVVLPITVGAKASTNKFWYSTEKKFKKEIKKKD